jgi:hypothetical protein
MTPRDMKSNRYQYLHPINGTLKLGKDLKVGRHKAKLKREAKYSTVAKPIFIQSASISGLKIRALFSLVFVRLFDQ